MNSNTVLYELKHNLFQPYTSSQYAACILAHNKNEPMNIASIINKIRELGWESSSKSVQYNVYNTLSGKFLGKYTKNIFIELTNKQFKLVDDFYDTCGEGLANYITAKLSSKKPENTTVLASTEKVMQPVQAEPVQVAQPQKPVSQNWNEFSERNDIDKLIRFGVPKEIIGFLYSSIRTESITHFLTSKNEEQITNAFVAFVFALNDIRVINWIFSCKEFPVNHNPNKYEQLLQVLVRNSKVHLVEHQTKQQKIAAFKMFNEMLKQNEDVKTLREGEEVRLVVMGETRIIPFGKAIYRSGEIFLKHES